MFHSYVSLLEGTCFQIRETFRPFSVTVVFMKHSRGFRKLTIIIDLLAMTYGNPYVLW